jgi:unsaturated rhamnogalacturonyl hydrolase
VQQIGEKPEKVTADDTEVYGVGAFLLAGSEMYRMMEKHP